ncbi:MAG: SsrA-binding protein SmpB [Puniceicoccales bacterium]|jgi:SsrA-binding protein|nr:SsrA-binding protein SmpB [Puniceicoccales bacterium]
MTSSKRSNNSQKEIHNKKAVHNYLIGDKFEAGVVLCGTEVKAIRQGQAQISDAFVRFNRASDAILFNANIAEYSFGNTENHPVTRARKLLLHKNELKKLKAAIEIDGLAVLPLRMFFSHGLVKVEIAICRGKKLFDKRETLKKRTALREAERALARFKR